MRKRKMLKQTKVYLGVNHYLLGRDKIGHRYWLREPQFVKERDKKSPHWEYLNMVILGRPEGYLDYYSQGLFTQTEFRKTMGATPLTEEELDELYDYISTYNKLRQVSLLFEQGYSDITEKAKIDDIQNKYSAAYINDRLIPQVIERIRHLLSE